MDKKVGSLCCYLLDKSGPNHLCHIMNMSSRSCNVNVLDDLLIHVGYGEWLYHCLGGIFTKNEGFLRIAFAFPELLILTMLLILLNSNIPPSLSKALARRTKYLTCEFVRVFFGFEKC